MPEWYIPHPDGSPAQYFVWLSFVLDISGFETTLYRRYVRPFVDTNIGTESHTFKSHVIRLFAIYTRINFPPLHRPIYY